MDISFLKYNLRIKLLAFCFYFIMRKRQFDFRKTTIGFSHNRIGYTHYNTRYCHLSILSKNFLSRSTNGLMKWCNQKMREIESKREEKSFKTNQRNKKDDPKVAFAVCIRENRRARACSRRRENLKRTKRREQAPALHYVCVSFKQKSHLPCNRVFRQGWGER